MSKAKRIFLLSGIPGSGKSTWAKAEVEKNGGIWCSRDAVRFSMLADNDEYFAHEDEVFEAWIQQICAALNDPKVFDVYVDATHLNDKSRNKTLNRLPEENIREIINVLFTAPVKTCLARNAQRTGRARVPDEVILRMAKSFSSPAKNRAIYVNERGEEFEW